jgi:anthranilate synthase component II
MLKILVLDNYDSFTFNLVHALQKVTGHKVDVFRNDMISLAEVGKYDKIVLSPGPGIPDEAGILKELIHEYGPSKSILGVCLGLQAIGEVYGGSLINLHKVFHGIATTVNLTSEKDSLFEGLPESFDAGRYHSWIVRNENLPSCLRITVVDKSGAIMGLSHTTHDVKGVQFHPESVLTPFGEKIITNWLAG